MPNKLFIYFSIINKSVFMSAKIITTFILLIVFSILGGMFRVNIGVDGDINFLDILIVLH